MKELVAKGHEVMCAFRVNSKNTARQGLANSGSAHLADNSSDLLLNFLS